MLASATWALRRESLVVCYLGSLSGPNPGQLIEFVDLAVAVETTVDISDVAIAHIF